MYGALAAALVAVIARGGASFVNQQLLGLAGTAISPILLAIVLGALARLLLPSDERLEGGYQFCLTWILRAGIVLLGLRLSLAATGDIGLKALPVVLVCIVVALLVVTQLGRVLGLSTRLGTLIAAGTSICGCTAIVATAPVIKAEKAEMSYAIGCITLFGLVAMFLNPLIARVLFESEPVKAGIFLGTSIHETAQVAGAGLIYQQSDPAGNVLEAATVTKLVRNLCMLLVIPVLSLAYSRARSGGESGPASFAVPWFVFGFVGLSALRTIGDIGEQPFGLLDAAAWAQCTHLAVLASEWCLTIAMAAVGLGTDFTSLFRIGIKPSLLAFFAATLIGVLAAVMLVVW